MLLSLQDIGRAQAFYAAGHWRAETLYMRLRHWAGEEPGAPFLSDPWRTLTRGAALGAVDAIAAELHGAGLKAGDRVAIWLPSRVESALVLLACSRMGYVALTSLHRDYTTPEVAELLERAGARALFTQAGYGADGQSVTIAGMGAALPRLARVFELADAAVAGPPEQDDGGSGLPAWSTTPDRVMYLAFTSGTTGAPKGVMHSDNTLLANGRAVARDWDLGPASVLYTLSPMSHNMGTVALAMALACGGALAVHPPGDADTMLARILHSGATYLIGVPTHAIDLLAAARRAGLGRLGAVTAFQLAGSAIPEEVAERLLALGVRPQNTYGMTENCSHQYTRPDDPLDVVVRTCGRPCAGFELKVFAESDPDLEVPPGTVGELGSRGACLMLGYFDDQRATEAAFNRAGWFMSGDLGRIDADGNLQIVGRKKDLIIRGGHNLHPARIEDLAMRHPAVLKTAVFPVPDARLGEKACIAVILREAAELEAMALLAHLDDLGLSRYDMPEYFIAVDAFPLTASGKILKRALVEMVRDGRIAPAPVRWTGARELQAADP